MRATGRKEMTMRPWLGAVALLALSCPSTPAAAYDYPWCAHYSGRNGGTNCGFVSFEQCRWTVSGVGGFCAVNPFYVAAHGYPQPKAKPKRRQY
jgi:hypothetical protein